MSETSYKFSTQHFKKGKHYQGGEQKVMKKSLSVLLAVAMVFSMFAGVAFAEEQSAIDRLDIAGIIQGGSDGDTMDDLNWKREDVAVLLSRLYGVEKDVKDNPQTHSFADVNNPDYHGVISWVSSEAAGPLMQGRNETTFGHGDFVTAQEFATVILRALGIEHEWEEAVAVAVDNGIYAEEYDNGVKLTRGQTWDPIVNALDTPLASGQTLGASLNLVGWEVEVADVSVDVVAANQIKVSFSSAVDADDVELALVWGLLDVDFDANWADDNKSVVLESDDNYQAGEYTLTVNEEEFEIEIEDQKLVSFTIVTEFLTKEDGQEVKVSPIDQYGNEFEAGDLVATATNVTNAGNPPNVSNVAVIENKFQLDLDAADVDDTIVVAVAHKSGLTETKTYKVLPAAHVASITLGQPEPKEDKVRIEAGNDELILPITLINQFGAEVDLDANTFGQIQFISSNANIIDVDEPTEFFVNGDGKLEFEVGDAGTVTITAIAKNTGQSASVTITVHNEASLASIQLKQPAGLIVAGEEVTVDYSALDEFGEAYKLSDPAELSWFSNNTGVVDPSIAAGEISITKDGEIKFTPKKDGAVSLTAYVDGKQQNSISLNVRAAKYPAKISGLNADAITTLSDNAGETTIDNGSIIVLDQYNRVIDKDDINSNYITLDFDGNDNGIVGIAGDTITAIEAGTQSVVVKFQIDDGADANFDDMDNPIQAKFTVTVIEDSKVVDYVREGARSTVLYNDAKAGQTNDHSKDHAITISIKHGLTEDGVAVGLSATDKANFTLTSSNPGQIKVVGAVVYADDDTHKDSTGTVTVWKKGKAIDSYNFTVSEADPYLAKFNFDKDHMELTVANNEVVVLKDAKDQYETSIDLALTDGKWFSTNEDVATVVNGVVTAEGEGEATITFVHDATGLYKSFKVTVSE